MAASLDEMATFVEVVNCQNFSKAAIKTGIPVSTISRRIANLESRLNTQLLVRTTRQQRLTDIGRIYYEHCSQMLIEAEAAEQAVQSLKVEPAGLLRITTPYVFEDPYASDMMQSFLNRHPKIQVEYIVSLRKIHLIEEGFDCALTPGALDDSSLRTRGLGTFKLIHCASPDYIERFGRPEKIEDLEHHHYVKHSYPSWINIPSSDIEEKIKCRLESNDLYVARRSAVGGIGIACLPKVFIQMQLDQGTLIPLLPEYDLTSPFNLVFPSNKQLTTKLRAFIDHMVEFSSNNAPWDIRKPT